LRRSDHTFEDFFISLKIEKGVNEIPIKEGLFRYIRGFSIIFLGEGERIGLESGGDEVGLVILEGRCDFMIDGETHKGLGERSDPFSGRPTGIYIPPKTEFTIIGHDVRLAMCISRCDGDVDFSIIRPHEVKTSLVGKENWAREVRMIFGPDGPSANLIVGETINPPGNWSGTPPHRHECLRPPDESLHEELYYFRTDRPYGFGIQRLYSKERGVDFLIPIRDNTVTFMPWGYHQVVAGPGYTLAYLFFLSGERKELCGFLDPEHRWLAE
jgi:5-deoxy-glucuronate isomerase